MVTVGMFLAFAILIGALVIFALDLFPIDFPALPPIFISPGWGL
jgi:hypothetical protein